MLPVETSTPGKVILVGEHAVVYGRPALVAAIDLRLSTRIEPLPGTERLRIELPAAPAVETTWEAARDHARAARDRWEGWAANPAASGFPAPRGDDPAHLVKVALGEAAGDLGSGLPSLPSARVRVESDLPIGSGFGSSAAAAVGIVAAALLFHAGEADPARVERLALEVERRQHGFPSGMDGAAVLRGGLIWGRRTAGGLELSPVAARSPLLSRLRVYDTGTPAEPTGAVVAAVRGLRERDPRRHEELLERLAAAAAALCEELSREAEDPDRTLHLFREAEICLEALGVVPREVREAVRRVEAAGGAAKVSGAGSLSGPGAGSLLVYHPDPERTDGWPFLQPFHRHPVHLGAPGLQGRIERERTPGIDEDLLT